MTHEMTGAELLGPYSPRNGDETDAELAVLLADPEIVLSPEDKQVAANFARGLVSGIWGETRVAATSQQTGEPLTFGEIDKYAAVTNRVTIYPDLAIKKGHKKMCRELGVYGHDPDDWHKVISQGIATGQLYHLDQLVEIDRRHDEWQRERLAGQLTRSVIGDADYSAPTSITVNFTPERLLQKAEGWQAYRSFYRQLRRQLCEQPASDLTEVQQTMLDVHIGAVNAKMAALYPDLIDFKGQMEATGLAGGPNGWGARLAAVTAVFNQQPEEILQYVRPVSNYARFIRRLDYIRNGVAVNNGQITPISPQTAKLARSIQEQRGKSGQRELAPVFSQAELECIRSVTWEAEQIKEFLEACLDTAGLLSSRKAEWNEIRKREGVSADGRWQVVISPKAKSISTNGRKRTMTIPAKSRKLDAVGPAGVLAVSPHELSHVMQDEQKRQLAQQLPIIDGFGGRRYDTVHEMGGILHERQMQAHLGHERPTGLTYFRGAQRLAVGANRLQVARAMYDDIREANKSRTAKEQRQQAANQAQRLFRKGGFDTQSIDYTAQDLILDSLSRYDPHTVKAIALGASSFALRDTAALHRVGMYEIPDPDNVPDPVELVLRVFRESFLPRLMSEHKAKVS